MRSILALALLAACGGQTSDPAADLPDGVTLSPQATHTAALARRTDDRFAAADAVVYAEVRDVQHRVSVADGADAPALPHTFVTLDVMRGFAGASDGDTLTLRLLGGPMGELTLAPAGMPTFEVGDQVVALVYANGETACPFVACSEGVLRVDDSGAWTAAGEPLSFVDGVPVVGETDREQSDSLVSWAATHAAALDLPGAASLDPDRSFTLHTEDGARMPLSFPVKAAADTPDARPDWMQAIDGQPDPAELRCLEANDFDPTLPEGC